MSRSSLSLKQRAYDDIKEFLILALYLWVVFGMFVVYKSIILAEHHIDFAPHGAALFNAVALAKIMLVGKKLHLGDKTNDGPLIYPILLKSAMFSILLACFKILEEVAIGLYRGEFFREALSDVGGGTWKALLSFVVLLFVVLIPLFGFTELQRVFGQEKLKQVLFRRAPLVKAASQRRL